MQRTNRRLCLAAMMAALFMLHISALRADLVAHWTFDGTLEDATLNANDGTFMGSPLPTFSNDVPTLIGQRHFGAGIVASRLLVGPWVTFLGCRI